MPYVKFDAYFIEWTKCDFGKMTQKTVEICIVENLLIYKEEICLNKLLLRIVGIIYILFT